MLILPPLEVKHLNVCLVAQARKRSN